MKRVRVACVAQLESSRGADSPEPHCQLTLVQFSPVLPVRGTKVCRGLCVLHCPNCLYSANTQVRKITDKRAKCLGVLTGPVRESSSWPAGPSGWQPFATSLAWQLPNSWAEPTERVFLIVNGRRQQRMAQGPFGLGVKVRQSEWAPSWQYPRALWRPSGSRFWSQREL